MFWADWDKEKNYAMKSYAVWHQEGVRKDAEWEIVLYPDLEEHLRKHDFV